MSFLGNEVKCTLKPPEKAKAFCPVSDVGEANTRRHGFDIFSNIIKILRGKYKAESY